MHLDVKTCAQPRFPRCCSVRFLGTTLAQIFLIPNSYFSIKRKVSQFMFTSSAIILTVNLRSDRNSSLACAVLSPVRDVDGRPLRCLSSKTVLPSENILFQRKTCALDIASSPKAYWSFPCVALALSRSLTQKKIEERCAIFGASISMTRFTDTSHVTHLLHTEALQSHATANGDGGRTKVKGFLC